MSLDVGRTVLYTLTGADADTINRRRTNPERIASKAAENPPQWHPGAQGHIGKPAEAGQVFPMMIVAVGPGTISGQVFLDGNDVLWVSNLADPLADV